MSIIRWEDPPPDRFVWKRIADELKANPGRWARVLEPSNKGTCANAYNGLTKHGCEIAQRSVDGQGTAMWARWVETA